MDIRQKRRKRTTNKEKERKKESVGGQEHVERSNILWNKDRLAYAQEVS